MKALKILAVVCSIIFLISLGAGISFAIAGFDEGLPGVIDALRDSKYVDGTREKNNLSVEGDGMTSLDISAGAAEVTLLREERSEVSVDYSYVGFGTSDREPVSVEREGNSVFIKTEVNENRNIFRWNKMDITVRIPQDYTGNLSLDIGAGVLRVKNEQEFGDVSITVGAGALSLDGMTARTVNADISVGKFTADRLHVQQLTLKVGAGAAELRDLTGSTDFTLDMGSATLEYDKLVGDITATVSMGAAVLRLPDEAGATLDITASVGSVSQDFGTDFTGESNNRRVRGTVNGGGSVISGQVDMGSLAVKGR